LDAKYASTHPNPVGFGCLAFFTFWPGIGLMIAGVGRRLAGKDF